MTRRTTRLAPRLLAIMLMGGAAGGCDLFASKGNDKIITQMNATDAEPGTISDDMVVLDSAASDGTAIDTSAPAPLPGTGPRPAPAAAAAQAQTGSTSDQASGSASPNDGTGAPMPDRRDAPTPAGREDSQRAPAPKSAPPKSPAPKAPAARPAPAKAGE